MYGQQTTFRLSYGVGAKRRNDASRYLTAGKTSCPSHGATAPSNGAPSPRTPWNSSARIRLSMALSTPGVRFMRAPRGGAWYVHEASADDVAALLESRGYHLQVTF